MTARKSCVAIFNTRDMAEQAIADLYHAGIDIKKLSIVGKGYEREEHVVGYYNAVDRVKFWVKRGAFWGGLWGILFTPAFLCPPGGIFLCALAGGLNTAVFVGSLSALGAALYSIGIPKNSIIKYETAIKMDKYLLIYHGTPKEVERASDILITAQDTEVATYDA